MPLTYMHGDLFSAPSDAILVIPVNCRGVAGCGLAKQCRERYPRWFEEYRTSCLSYQLSLGHLLLHVSLDRWIIDFPTKDDWRSPSRLADIEAGLCALSRQSASLTYVTAVLAVPKLGCGAGGLCWRDVQPLMERYLEPLPLQVWLYL
jgi:O-acetyl-ADP-ribose deacetylase (regulator of RNase III)